MKTIQKLKLLRQRDGSSTYYVSIAMMVFLFLSVGFPSIMALLFIPMFIASIAALVLLMGLMKQAAQAF